MKNKNKIILVSILIITTLISSTFTILNVEGAESNPPLIIINFAGNLSDKGGPLWRPPDEGMPLNGEWKNGYYTNDSRQLEDWLYINLTVTDETDIDIVWLQWLNETSWTNWTYEFIYTGDDYFEINTSELFKTSPGFNYSFNIVANDTLSNSRTIRWEKIGAFGNKNRRFVQLNSQVKDISYSPLYLHESECYGDSGVVQDDDDRLHHDQGPPCGDTGYLTYPLPGSKIEHRTCGAIIAYWFDESICIDTFKLNNIYFHVWWSTTDNTNMEAIGWDKSRTHFENDTIESYTARSSTSRSYLYYDCPVGSNHFYLDTHLLDVSETIFSDNDIYEFVIKLRDDGGNPTVISNRSIMSFIILNVPNNNTLNTSFYDSDQDGLTDWQELYVTYTSPFLWDTDNDGKSDCHEYLSGTDSNNFNDNSNGPPNIPSITGPTKLKVGQEYEYTFKSTDNCADDVFYFIKWGDGQTEEWIGPFPSGEEVKINHTWEKVGSYNISAKSKDIYNATSDWGGIVVIIPKNKLLDFESNLLVWLYEKFQIWAPILQFLRIFLHIP